MPMHSPVSRIKVNTIIFKIGCLKTLVISWQMRVEAKIPMRRNRLQRVRAAIIRPKKVNKIPTSKAP